jgi:hypothetical protein
LSLPRDRVHDRLRYTPPPGMARPNNIKNVNETQLHFFPSLFHSSYVVFKKQYRACLTHLTLSFMAKVGQRKGGLVSITVIFKTIPKTGLYIVVAHGNGSSFYAELCKSDVLW